MEADELSRKLSIREAEVRRKEDQQEEFTCQLNQTHMHIKNLRKKIEDSKVMINGIYQGKEIAQANNERLRAEVHKREG